MKAYALVDHGAKTILAYWRHSDTVDAALNLIGWTVDDEGQCIDDDGDLTDHWYDELDITLEYEGYKEELLPGDIL